MNDVIEQIIQGIVVNVAVKFAIADIVVAIPFLGFPVVGPIFALLAGWLGGKIATALVKLARVEIITFQTDAEKKAYDAAVGKLAVVVNQPVQDPALVKKAQDEFKADLHKLISLRA